MPFEFPVITANDLLAVAFLVFLEGILSVDNALVLAIVVRPLPKKLQKRALTYGLAGAVIFRIMAIGGATYLMHWHWVKYVGGAYLIYLPLKYKWDKLREEKKEARVKESQRRAFWMTVLVVELSDIMFAIDSILTAVALTRKVWIVITGGILGLIAMRFAAGLFIQLLAKFPRFEPTAYILVFLVGLKLLLEGFADEFQWEQINFHDPKMFSFWGFWGAMLAAFCYGFVPSKKASH